MPNARHITQQIAEFLATQGRGGTGRDIAALAAGYAELTRQAHERLGRCHDYIARGLRSEAIQEADLEPSLLGVIAALDLEAFDTWDDYCRKYDLPRPHAMSRGVTQELNRAYAADQLVAPLLREYRFRCLSRGPLLGRIAALRGVAGLDKNNRVWHESLVELETARLAELRVEVEKSLADPDRLREIQREMLDDRRRVKAPDSLIQRVESALLSTMVAKAQLELRELLPALDEAYSAMDYRACNQLLESWNQTLKSVGQSHLHLPDDLRQPVQPIIDWVQTQAYRQQQDSLFRAACGRLSTAVSGDSTLEELNRAYEHAASFEQPLPDTLAEDYRRARQGLELAAARRRRFRLASAAAAVLLLSIAVGWTVNRRVTNQSIADSLASVSQATAQDQLGAAEDQWQGLVDAHPNISNRADALAVRKQLEAALDKENKRRDDFVSLHETLSQSDVAEFDTADVSRLAELAKSEDEIAQADAINQAFRDHQFKLAQQRDADALAQAVELRKQLAAIDPKQIDQDPDPILRELNTVDSALFQLRTTASLSDSTLAALTAVEQKSQSIRKAADFVAEKQGLARQQAEALNQVRASTRSAASLSGAITRFAETYAETSPLAEDFARAAIQAEAWQSVENWEAFVGRIDFQSRPKDLLDIAQRVRDIEQYLAEHPESPMRSDAEAARSYWGQVLLASSDTGPWLSRLPEILRAPVIRDLNAFSAGEGRRYYLVGQGDRRETSLGTTIAVVLTPDVTQPTTINLKPHVAGPIVDSPQSQLASKLLTMIAEYELSDSDTFHLDILETILTAQEVDPILRAILGVMVIDEHEKTSGTLDADLSRLRSQLAANNEQGLNWLDPDNLAAATVRDQLKPILTRDAIDFTALRQAAKARSKTLGGPLLQGIAARGVLLPNDDGTLSVQGLDADPVDGWSAYAVTKDPAALVTRLAKVGRVVEQEVQLDRSAVNNLPAGSMVFLVPPGRDSANAAR